MEHSRSGEKYSFNKIKNSFTQQTARKRAIKRMFRWLVGDDEQVDDGMDSVPGLRWTLNGSIILTDIDCGHRPAAWVKLAVVVVLMLVDRLQPQSGNRRILEMANE